MRCPRACTDVFASGQIYAAAMKRKQITCEDGFSFWEYCKVETPEEAQAEGYRIGAARGRTLRDDIAEEREERNFGLAQEIEDEFWQMVETLAAKRARPRWLGNLLWFKGPAYTSNTYCAGYKVAVKTQENLDAFWNGYREGVRMTLDERKIPRRDGEALKIL